MLLQSLDTIKSFRSLNYPVFHLNFYFCKLGNLGAGVHYLDNQQGGGKVGSDFWKGHYNSPP
ncbi:Hypothetical protein I595_1401 [Croceitalea dokdonensis DOKDO 023]|uniref:Uncharacterized protein n=1 Tax=Croceitalea dokdonensis DOKDO 023 TaxID=1300341 RepID=A0A0P7AHD7_9FLAO|nr:Hypothetical protein I595_1401 [Croceitalea dokdonensis DOKDO 023]